jgi:hypothetical protein
MVVLMDYWYNPKLEVYFSKETYELMQSKGFVGDLSFEEALSLEMDELDNLRQLIQKELDF